MRSNRPDARNKSDLPLQPAASAISNRLLAALPRTDCADLQHNLEPVRLAAGDELNQAGAVLRHVYFPEDCLASLLAVEQDGPMIEIWQIGREGMVGLPEILENDSVPMRARIQAGGSAWRMDSACFRQNLHKSAPLQRVVCTYALRLMLQARQIAVCSHFHMLEARLARSLLTTCDRLGTDAFHLTHEFLALTLGARRVGVTKAANALQQRHLIAYSRGDIHILDRQGLEAAACACYAAIRALDGDG